MSNERHIFISYARDDGKEFAFKVRDHIEQLGFRTWIDEKNIPEGMNWHDAIEEALHATQALLVVITPASVASEWVKMEWLDMLSSYRPVVPLLALDTKKIPLALRTLQWVDFREDYDGALANLTNRLKNLHSEHLETLRDKLQHYINAQSAAIETRVRENYQLKINELERIIRDLDSAVADTNRQLVEQEQRLQEQEARLGKIAEESARIQGDLAGERTRLQQQISPGTALRIVGQRFVDMSQRFYDREDERRKLRELVYDRQSHIRLVSIHGRSGIGKTALVGSVLDDLTKSEDALNVIDGIVVLDASAGLDLQNLYLNCVNVLDVSEQGVLESVWSSEKLAISEKCNRLVSAFDERRFLILIDNVETIQDHETGKAEDTDLSAFFAAWMSQVHRSIIIVTSQIKFSSDNQTRSLMSAIPLNDGLPINDANKMLRELDPDGTLGLADANDALLTKAAIQVGGLPRALEIIASMLAEDPLSDIETLLDEDLLFTAGDKIDELIGDAYRRLSPSSRRVMEALSIYTEPIPIVAVEYIISRFHPEVDAQAQLRHLISAHKIRLVDRRLKLISLHQTDRVYIYKTIPETEAVGRTKLHLAAAEYYAQLQSSLDMVENYAQLNPYMMEFDHRLNAGDYEAAVKLLNRIEPKLWNWGYSAQVLSMTDELVKLIDPKESPHAQIDTLIMHGYARYNMGLFEQALSDFERVKPILDSMDASARETLKRRNSFHNAIGVTLLSTGRYEDATVAFEQALEISRKLNDQRTVSSRLQNLGHAYKAMGHHTQALNTMLQALSVAQQRDKREEVAARLMRLGTIYSDLGDYDESIKSFEAGFAQATVEMRRIHNYGRAHLGETHLRRGQYIVAEDELRRSLDISMEIYHIPTEQHTRTSLAQLYLHSKKLKEAYEIIEPALRYEVGTDVHRMLLIAGCVAGMRGERQRAADLLSSSLSVSSKLTQHSPRNYSAQYSKALALVALTVFVNDNRLAQAKTSFKHALDTCNSKGVLADSRLVLDTILIRNEKEDFAEIRALLQ